MLKISLKIDKLSQRVIKSRDLAFKQDQTGFGKSIEDAESGYKDYNTQIDAPIVAAFITFEYSESMARCVEDYTRFQSWPRSLFYPQVQYISGNSSSMCFCFIHSFVHSYLHALHSLAYTTHT